MIVSINMVREHRKLEKVVVPLVVFGYMSGGDCRSHGLAIYVGLFARQGACRQGVGKS